jgi:WhiB family redox-sensing transcriptional regulator
MPDLTWMDAALCAQTDPDLFHPEGQGAKYGDAKKVCGRCPVQAACDAFAQSFEGAIAKTHRSGMWAAKSPQQRERAARRRTA